MLERVQGHSWLSALNINMDMNLRGPQKALAQWAIVDDFTNILDLHCQDGRLLQYFSQKFSLRVCGIADDPEEAKALRTAVPDAEIFCARKTDIPWRDDTFETVFYQLRKKDGNADLSFLSEAARVLSPGGQLLIAVQGMPEFAGRALSFLGLLNAEEHITPAQLLRGMEEAGLSDVSYRLTQPTVGLAMGWKRA